MFFDNFFRKNIETKAHNLAMEKFEEMLLSQREHKLESQMLEFPIGTMVICRSNEWDDLNIGKIVGYHIFGTDTLVYEVYDFILKSNVLVFGIVRHFSTDLLRLLLKHDPFEQYLLLTRGFDNALMNKKKLQPVLSPPEKYWEALKEHNIQ